MTGDRSFHPHAVVATVPEFVPTALAAFVVVLFAAALVTMAADRLTVAGLCFLSASLLIYLRERWVREPSDDTDADTGA
jgi:hypothetical protein